MRSFPTLSLALAALCAGSGSALAQPANDCSDPYWADTLRCLTAPSEMPQPVPPPPATPAQIKEYTRVDLEFDADARCLDGTRPILYVSPADDLASERWILSITGGGSCGAADLDDDGSYEDGSQCAQLYVGGEASEMGTAFHPAMRNLGSGATGRSEGILDPDPARNPLFSGFHRVRIQKCSYDRYAGWATHPGVAANGSSSYTLYNQGARIVDAALQALRGDPGTGLGLTYTTWVEQGGGVVPVEVTLPPLESAGQVLFVGHSGGAHGLFHWVDRVAEGLGTWSGFAGDVRVLLDANLVEGPENEAAFDPGQSADLYDHVWTGTSPVLGAYDAEPFLTDSFYVDGYDAWLPGPGAPLELVFDRSCLEAHAASDGATWTCRDRVHVLANHMTTPAFVREDFEDPNTNHTLNGLGHPVAWGPWGPYVHCSVFGFSPCPPLMPLDGPSTHRQRLVEQVTRILLDASTRSELATGEDPSGPVPTRHFWMPACGTHESAYGDWTFFDSRIEGGSGARTMNAWLAAFVAAPATGVAAARIDGVDGASRCSAELPFVEGFESGDTLVWSRTVD